MKPVPDPAKEIAELRQALSGRTVSCEQCNTLATENHAMREAIREAYEHTKSIYLETLKQWDATKPLPDTGTVEKAAVAALTKLQPFITPKP